MVGFSLVKLEIHAQIRTSRTLITYERNTVKTQMMSLSYRSKVENELQPYFHQNEWSSGLDINICLYGQPSVRRGHRDHLQSATPKRDTTKNIQ